MKSNLDSVEEEGGSYMSNLAREAAESTRALRDNIQNRTSTLIDDFKSRLNLISIIICLIIFILMCVFIFTSYVAEDKNVYFTILQYGSIIAFVLILFSFFFISRTGSRNKRY